MASLFRHSARTLVRLPLRQAAEAATVAATKNFQQVWREVAPLLDPPTTAIDLLPKAAEASAEGSKKLKFGFYLPHDIKYQSAEVDMVVVPSIKGQLGMEPGLVPTVTQLKPGVVSVHSEGEKKDFFVSGGFAFVHPDSTAQVCAIEAFPLDHIDGEAVKKGLADATAALASAESEADKAAAQIGVEVYTAMGEALTA
eukprot:jgi/Mesvir1/24738/Mv22001-RA.1